MAEVKRADRVSELVLRELSLLLIRALKDPRLRGINLTRVQMDDDLRHGRVFFSHLEGNTRAAAALAGFKSCTDLSNAKSVAPLIFAARRISNSNSIPA